MTSIEQAKAYQQFFFKSEAGKAFINMLQTLEDNHIRNAQRENSLDELSKSAGIREIRESIDSVIAQVAGQVEE